MNKTLKLACTAMLTALSIVTNLFTIPIGLNNAISFTFVICWVAGVYLGIVPAIAVGFLGDLIAHLIHPFGAYNWFIALASLLAGVICALVYKIRMHKLLKLLVAVAIFFVIGTIGLNTFGLWLQYIVGVDASPIGLVQFFKMDKSGIEKSFWTYLAVRVPYQLINTVANAAIVATLQQTKALDRAVALIAGETPPTGKSTPENGQNTATDVILEQKTDVCTEENAQNTDTADSDKG